MLCPALGPNKTQALLGYTGSGRVGEFFSSATIRLPSASQSDHWLNITPIHVPMQPAHAHSTCLLTWVNSIPLTLIDEVTHCSKGTTSLR